MRVCLPMLLVVMLAAVPVLAADGLMVQEIQVHSLGEVRLDEGFIRAHIGVQEGVTLDPRKVSRDVKDLLATGRFTTVRVDAEAVEEGVRLVYRVKGRRRVAGVVALKGVAYFSAYTIQEILGLDASDVVDDQVLGVRARKIEQLYRESYFQATRVTWTQKPLADSPDRVRITVTVNEGVRAKVRNFVYEGNTVFSDNDFRKPMQQQAWWNPLWWQRKRRYDPQELETARAGIRAMYLDRGYLDVRIGKPAIEVDEDGDLTVRVKIEEGLPYTVGRVTTEGITKYPELDVKRSVAVRTGDVASMSMIRAGVMAMSDHYGNDGYLGTRVTPMLDADAKTRRVNVHFKIREGRKAKIRNVRIRGNARTRDKVIRRALLVYPGDPYNSVRVRSSERRLMNLGYFSRAKAMTVPTANPDEFDLVVDVEEKQTGQFMIGAGFSSIEKIIGFVELTQSNFDLQGWPHFTGGGQKLRLSGRFGDTTKAGELTFIEPWFLDRPLSLGTDIYRRESNYTDYDIKRTGGRLSLGKRLGVRNRGDIRYRIERQQLSDIADTNEYTTAAGAPYYFDEDTDTTISSLRLSFSRDTRNTPFFPTYGGKVLLSGSVSGGILGADVDMYSLGVKTSRHVPLWYGHVLTLKAQYDVIDSYADTDDIPLGNRLFLGGGRTLRGFKLREVGPKVSRAVESEEGASSVQYRSIGGQSRLMATVEYTIPLIQRIRLAGFYETGNLWEDPYEADVTSLAATAGIGLRLDLPGFPVRIDRAWVVNEVDESSDTETWVFWIGYDN